MQDNTTLDRPREAREGEGMTVWRCAAGREDCVSAGRLGKWTRSGAMGKTGAFRSRERGVFKTEMTSHLCLIVESG